MSRIIFSSVSPAKIDGNSSIFLSIPSITYASAKCCESKNNLLIANSFSNFTLPDILLNEWNIANKLRLTVLFPVPFSPAIIVIPLISISAESIFPTFLIFNSTILA